MISCKDEFGGQVQSHSLSFRIFYHHALNLLLTELSRTLRLESNPQLGWSEPLAHQDYSPGRVP